MENDYLFPGTIDTRSSLGWEWPNRTSACTASRQQLSNQRRLGSLGTDLRAGWQKNSYVEQCGWSLRSSECLFLKSIVLAWKWNVRGVFQTNCWETFQKTESLHTHVRCICEDVHVTRETAQGFCLFRLNEAVSLLSSSHKTTKQIKSIFKLSVRFDHDSPEKNEKAVKSSRASCCVKVQWKQSSKFPWKLRKHIKVFLQDREKLVPLYSEQLGQSLEMSPLKPKKVTLNSPEDVHLFAYGFWQFNFHLCCHLEPNWHSAKCHTHITQPFIISPINRWFQPMPLRNRGHCCLVRCTAEQTQGPIR